MIQKKRTKHRHIGILKIDDVLQDDDVVVFDVCLKTMRTKRDVWSREVQETEEQHYVDNVKIKRVVLLSGHVPCVHF